MFGTPLTHAGLGYTPVEILAGVVVGVTIVVVYYLLLRFYVARDRD